MRTFTPILLMVVHGLTQIVMQAGALQLSTTEGMVLFATRLVADLGICWWIIGPERRMSAWIAIRTSVAGPHKHAGEIQKTHAT
jgi:hypothetical protein